MTPTEIRLIVCIFPTDFARLLWDVSEAWNLPLGDTAPLIFGMSIGCSGVKVDE